MDFDPPGSAMGGDGNPTFGRAEAHDHNSHAEQAVNSNQANDGQQQELYSPGPDLHYSPLSNGDPGD